MERYEIWYASVRYEDEDYVKERPVLIWGEQAFIIAYKMTGTDRGDTKDEFTIQYWKEAGLSKPTSIRLHKLLRLQQSDLKRKIGNLDIRDRLRFELRIASR